MTIRTCLRAVFFVSLVLALGCEAAKLRRREKQRQRNPDAKVDLTVAFHAHFSKDQACECLDNGLPEAENPPSDVGFEGPAIERVADDGKKSYFPKSYGSKCKAWENDLDPACKSDFPPAHCASKWCYVSSDCKVDDVKKTMYFPGKKLYYSYKNCGSFDAFTAQACLKKNEEKCSDPCAWNKANGACQNKLCQCTGDNKLEGEKQKKWGDDYGEKCSAWDKDSCENWKDNTEGGLGLWCCKKWCYVEESCPSAKPSAVAKGLFYTYYTCPDDVEEIKQCPWKKPVDFTGKPLPLTPEAREALEAEAKKSFATQGASVGVAAMTALLAALFA